jgi:hypothetical protein
VTHGSPGSERRRHPLRGRVLRTSSRSAARSCRP